MSEGPEVYQTRDGGEDWQRGEELGLVILIVQNS